MSNAIRTNDGRLVDPFNPKPEDVRPKVIIHSLAQLNRFTGHADWPYSVAQHTENLYWYVRPELKRAALIHDFSENWFNDLASPVKAKNKVYKRHEHKAGLFIASVLGVNEQELEALDYYDKAIYIDERNALFSGRELQMTGMGDERHGLGINPIRFRERHWKDVRDGLGQLFIQHFGREVYER